MLECLIFFSRIVFFSFVAFDTVEDGLLVPSQRVRKRSFHSAMHSIMIESISDLFVSNENMVNNDSLVGNTILSLFESELARSNRRERTICSLCSSRNCYNSLLKILE